MSNPTATAVATANIAFIKYWGDRDRSLRLPVNGSISMNLAGLFTRTTVEFDTNRRGDALVLNNEPASPLVLERASRFLDHVRMIAGKPICALIHSENNFPTGAGIASSASAFAALAVAASQALEMNLSESQLSRLARIGSGSACRSIPGGFVEWRAGTSDEDSYAESIVPPNYWDLVDCVAVVKTGEKAVGSSQGHEIAGTSPLQAARVAGAPQRLADCRSAILNRDFSALARIVELDSNLMHAVMMTSVPPLFYWEPASLDLIKAIPAWRRQGWPVCYTLDAGPNVHVLCESSSAPAVQSRLEQHPGVKKVFYAVPGGPAHIC